MSVIEKVDEFSKDMKKLLSKFRTLESDVERFKDVIRAPRIKIRGLELGQLHGAVRINRLGSKVTTPIFKFKHFRCTALRNKGARSGIRVIYAYEKKKEKYTLIEIYFKKGNKVNEDRARILKYFGQSCPQTEKDTD